MGSGVTARSLKAGMSSQGLVARDQGCRVTSDLNTTFGHRPIYIRGEAATFIPHSSKAFIHNQGTERPRG